MFCNFNNPLPRTGCNGSQCFLQQFLNKTTQCTWKQIFLLKLKNYFLSFFVPKCDFFNLSIISSRFSNLGLWNTSWIYGYIRLPVIVRIMSGLTAIPWFQIQHDFSVSYIFCGTLSSWNTGQTFDFPPARFLFSSTFAPRFLLTIGNFLCILGHSSWIA